MRLEYTTILEELAYYPIKSKVEEILRNSASKSLEIVGKSPSRALLDFISLQLGLSSEQILTSYPLLEQSLTKIFGNAAHIILDLVKREILERTNIISNSSSLTIQYILEQMHTTEIYEFIRSIPPHEHICFLYENESSKNTILSNFFDFDITDKVAKGLISIKPSNLFPINSVKNIILYEEFSHLQKSEAMNKMTSWISEVHSSHNCSSSQEDNDSKYATRIAGEDASWFFRNNLTCEFIAAEKSIGKRIQPNMSVLCFYDSSKLATSIMACDQKNILKTIFESHDYVLLDKPFSIHRQKGEKRGINQ